MRNWRLAVLVVVLLPHCGSPEGSPRAGVREGGKISASLPAVSLPPSTSTTTLGSSRVDVGEVHFLDAAFGWAPVSQDCGDHACVVVYVSDDGGASWLPRTDRPVAVGDGTNGWVAAVPAVRLATKDIGWLIDVEGKLYSTTNGARTWRPERTEGAVVALEAHGESVWRLEQSCPASDARCRYALLTSEDYGATWRPAEPQPPMGQSGVSSIRPSLVRPSADVAYVLSDSGDYPDAGHPGEPRPSEWKPDPILVHTEDGGRTWTEITTPCPATGKGGYGGADLAASIPEDLWLVCRDAAYSGAMQPKHLYRSTDGGESWSEDLGTPNAGSGGKTAAATPTRACRGGSRTGIACTRDGGRSWFFPIGGAENPRDGGVQVAQFVDDRHGWAIAQDNDSGNHNVLWRTTDGGESWSATRIAS